MTRYPAVFLVVILGLTLFVLATACTPRLDDRQVRARLVEQMHLENDQLHIVAITRERTPVASVDYAGTRADIRFRRQDGVWVIDAVGQGGRWEPADQAVPNLARELSARARAKWVQSEMARYARTFRLLVGWTELLSNSCPELPASQRALVDLHAARHRALFRNRGGEFHSFDLFVRDAWWKPMRLSLTSQRVDVQSSGADGRMDTPDDVHLTYEAKAVRPDVTYCVPHYSMPELVADSLGNPDSPKEWNCSEIVKSLKTAEMLELVSDRR
jgi:hypothetical protein